MKFLKFFSESPIFFMEIIIMMRQKLSLIFHYGQFKGNQKIIRGFKVIKNSDRSLRSVGHTSTLALVP